VIAEAVEHVGAQRIERQVERDLEISRQMRAGDLVAVRLEIVNETLAETELLAQSLLGREVRSCGFEVAVVVRRPGFVVVTGVAGTGLAMRRVAGCDAFDQTLVEANSPRSPIVTITPARARSLSL
jgi:hypothetical protein